MLSMVSSCARWAMPWQSPRARSDLAGSSTGTFTEGYIRASQQGRYYFAVLVCRAVAVKLNCTKSDANAAEKVSAREFDSTGGKRVFRRLVMYEADQCYPEYVVFKRNDDKDPEEEEETAKPRKRRLLMQDMQVPLHCWSVATN